MKYFNVISVMISLLVLLSQSCQENTSDDYKKVLNVFLKNYKSDNDLDSIYLGLENSNSELFERYERLLEKSESMDSLALKIFSRTEYENFKNQIIEEGEWDKNMISFDNLSYGNKTDLLYVTKPIFTSNREYAIIYGYVKGKSGVYFLPPIEIYHLNGSSWERVTIIKDTGLKQ